MKNFLVAFLVVILTACTTPQKFSNFDYSYARSGGYAPIYENLLIKGNEAHYRFEKQNVKIKKDFMITDDELRQIEETLSENNFRLIQEDYKKLYDNISISINVKRGPNSGSKSDASLIMEKDKAKWNHVTDVFQRIINSRNLSDSAQ